MNAIKIQVNLSGEKINLINDNYKYGKEAALERALDQNHTNELKDSASLSFFLTHKAEKKCKEGDGH